MLILHRGLYQSFGQQQRLIVIAEPRCRHRLLHDIRQHFHAGPAFAWCVLPENLAGFFRVSHAPQRGHTVRIRKQHGLIVRIGGQLAQKLPRERDFDRAAVLALLEQNAHRAAEQTATVPEYPRNIRERLQGKKAVQTTPEKDGIQRMVDRAAKRAEGKGAISYRLC